MQGNLADGPCNIFFHLPKTGGQTFHNLISREYQHESVLTTHCGLLTPAVWDHFTQGIKHRLQLSRFRAVTGHMKFGMHEMLPGPSRYITFLRDPVKRFASYYYMLRKFGLVPMDHQMDPDRPDWNLSSHASLPRELDNGQTRALANADWNLPFGQCTEDHLKTARDHLDRYFAFVGLTEQFDLSLMVLKRLCGWRWHFYARKNITVIRAEHRLPPETLESISRLNRFDRQLHAYAQKRLEATARSYGVNLRLEHGAYVACNAVHQCIHHVRYSLKNMLKQELKTESKGNGISDVPRVYN